MSVDFFAVGLCCIYVYNWSTSSSCLLSTSSHVVSYVCFLTDKLPRGKGGVVPAVQPRVLRASPHVRGRPDVPGLWHRHSVRLLQRLPPSRGLREVPPRPGEGGTEGGLGLAAQHKHTRSHIQTDTQTRTHSHTRTHTLTPIVRTPFFVCFYPPFVWLGCFIIPLCFCALSCCHG